MEKISPLIISVTGWSGSGKTTFCEKLIKELKHRGFQVAAGKSSHRNIETDKEGSDSKRFFNAGADGVCLNAENSLTVFYSKPVDSGNRLQTLFPDADMIVAEGFKSDNAFRIEVTGMIDNAEDMKNPASGADIVIYGNKDLIDSFSEAPAALMIHRDDIASAADSICSRLT